MKKLILSTFLTILSLVCFAQTSPDTLTYLTPQDAKIVNLMANELDKFKLINAEKDTIIQLKDSKIEGLTRIIGFKSEQLTICATEVKKVSAENKKLHRKIIFWQVVSGVALVVGLLL
jgi:hypothetical protein